VRFSINLGELQKVAVHGQIPDVGRDSADEVH
jgi:hypothetical protein